MTIQEYPLVQMVPLAMMLKLQDIGQQHTFIQTVILLFNNMKRTILPAEHCFQKFCCQCIMFWFRGPDVRELQPATKAAVETQQGCKSSEDGIWILRKFIFSQKK